MWCTTYLCTRLGTRLHYIQTVVRTASSVVVMLCCYTQAHCDRNAVLWYNKRCRINQWCCFLSFFSHRSFLFLLRCPTSMHAVLFPVPMKRECAFPTQLFTLAIITNTHTLSLSICLLRMRQNRTRRTTKSKSCCVYVCMCRCFSLFFYKISILYSTTLTVEYVVINSVIIGRIKNNSNAIMIDNNSKPQSVLAAW